MLGIDGQTDIMEANALGHMTDKIHISSNSWGPSDDGRTDAQPGKLLSEALETAARNVRPAVLCIKLIILYGSY